MADRYHLTMNSNEIKGNNPFQLKRMTVDSSFKKSNYDITQMVGYGANGDVISNASDYNPFNAPSQRSHQMFAKQKAPSGPLEAANSTAQYSPLNEEHFVSKNESKKRRKKKVHRKDALKANIKAIQGLVVQHTDAPSLESGQCPGETLPAWKQAFAPASAVMPSSLQRLTEQRYQNIMGEPRY